MSFDLGVYDTVDAVTEEERASYGPIDFDVEEYRKDIGTNKLIKSDKVRSFHTKYSFDKSPSDRITNEQMAIPNIVFTWYRRSLCRSRW